MEMTNKEIARRYQGAANKKEQVQILADLNDCGFNDIIDALEEEGVAVDVKRKRGPKPSEPKPQPQRDKNKELLTKMRDANRKLLEENKKLKQSVKSVEQLNATLEKKSIESQNGVPEIIKRLCYERMEDLNTKIVMMQTEIDSITGTKAALEDEYKELADFVAQTPAV